MYRRRCRDSIVGTGWVGAASSPARGPRPGSRRLRRRFPITSPPVPWRAPTWGAPARDTWWSRCRWRSLAPADWRASGGVQAAARLGRSGWRAVTFSGWGRRPRASETTRHWPAVAAWARISSPPTRGDRPGRKVSTFYRYSADQHLGRHRTRLQ